MQNFDLIIIGAGRASNIAAKAGKLGKKVALIEKLTLGGTCPNRGCVPSKLLIGYAQKIREIKESKKHFIRAIVDNIDQEEIFKRTNEYIYSVEENYKKKFNDNVTIFKGEGSFLDDKIVKVNNTKLTAPKIIIATGTRPAKVPFKNAWTSDDIFPLIKEIPESITIVGGGFIACELANFFDAIGVKTTQLVRGDTLLENEDEDISEIFKEQYCKNVNVKFNISIKNALYKNNSFEIELDNDETYKNDALLFAIGRVSNADTLKLENTNIKLNEKGFIKRDEFFQTDVEGVYVVGDASGEHMLQHAAAFEMNHLFKMLFEDEKEPLKFKYMPHAVFSHPEVASVGLTEKKAKEQNIKYVTSTTSWLASAKAQALKIKYPRTKFILNPDTYEILGCHLIGYESATMIHQVLAIMHLQNDIRNLKEMLYIHPALSEALLPAAVQAVKAINEYKESKKI
ncbi:dihydrolipoyl dehydrogenase family protein [Malaciobacter canalis]|uniref:dihydrolipoyl dehydrogenase family protein n=1 Tax=Malaciobacter canalis TaxID=1912871 RepID=UPI00384F5F69